MLKIRLIKKLLLDTSKYVGRTTINNNCYLKKISTSPRNYIENLDNSEIEKSTNKKILAGSMVEVHHEIMKRLGLDCGYITNPKPRDHLTKFEPKLEDLPPRTMQDSFTSAIVPLSTNKRLQNQYVTVLGNVRLGRLMEDMDLFAVWVCHNHVCVPNLDTNIHLPYTFVTVLVDKIDFTDMKTYYDQDIRLSGHVSWVGRTSMEIVVWLEQIDKNGEYKKITRALFLMAARNATNTKSAPVNPLTLTNDNERKIFADGEERKNRRNKVSQISLIKSEPNDCEQAMIHDLFMRTLVKNSMTLSQRILPDNCKWMNDTIVSNIATSFPENRNAHNTVFGGFLMRLALELSWICAFKYLGKRPILEHICDISFQKPVHISSFIKLTAQVIYTEMNFIQIMTIVDSINFEGNNTKKYTSNVFYYTFSNNEKVPEVIPREYHEAMWYIEGKRKLEYAIKDDRI